MLQRISFAIVFFAMIGTMVNAEAHHAQQCGNLRPDLDGDADRAFQCITDLELKLEELAGLVDSQARMINTLIDDMKNTIPAVGNHENTAAIIAFYSDKGKKSCPENWSPYELAKDRFILGAGGKYQTVGKPGGEETVTLSVAQMPGHGHSLPYHTTGDEAPGKGHGSPPSPYFKDRVLIVGPLDKGSGETGGNQPHNNMPPYIALYFCKKD